MLGAIQDFMQDSFSGVDQQGLDTLRLGELRLWSEMGPFAMLVAVIRGNPPEELHETLRGVLARIHAERPRAPFRPSMATVLASKTSRASSANA